jgi:hypothetical protein
MKSVAAAAALSAALLAASGCGGSSHGSASALHRASMVARNIARSLDDPSAKTAEVFGPASYTALVNASQNVSSTAHRSGSFYLLVLHGRFVCAWCSRPPGGKSPTGRTVTQIWSPAAGRLDLSILHRGLAPSISRLGRPTPISWG